MAEQDSRSEPASRDERIRRIVEAFVRRRAEGEQPNSDDLLAQHADLMPELRDVLLERELIDDARRAAGLDETAEADLSSGTGLSAPDDRILQSLLQSLPEYQVIRRISRGGQGAVYLARQRSLDRLVAIKVCLPGASIHRFVREAQIMASIRSPHVVTVHDFALLDDNAPVLVMEWIEGSDLARLIREQTEPPPESRVLPWMRQSAAGMRAAAEQGIVHRDLKPSDDLIASDHRCWECNYNLRGLSPLGRCPECGTAIDLSRLPVGRHWKMTLALAASFWLLILLAGSIFLDVAAAATAFWQFVVIVTLLGAVVAPPVWAITKRRGPAVLLAILIAVLLVLPFVPTTPRKPFIRFYGRVRYGMSQADVLKRLDARFPNRIANGRPSVVVQPDMITVVCDPYDWRYNAEVIWIDFKDDAVIGKCYSPD